MITTFIIENSSSLQELIQLLDLFFIHFQAHSWGGGGGGVIWLPLPPPPIQRDRKIIHSYTRNHKRFQNLTPPPPPPPPHTHTHKSKATGLISRPHGVRQFQVKPCFPGNAQKLTYVAMPRKVHTRDRFTLPINKIPLYLGKQTCKILSLVKLCPINLLTPLLPSRKTLVSIYYP